MSLGAGAPHEGGCVQLGAAAEREAQTRAGRAGDHRVEVGAGGCGGGATIDGNDAIAGDNDAIAGDNGAIAGDDAGGGPGRVGEHRDDHVRTGRIPF